MYTIDTLDDAKGIHSTKTTDWRNIMLRALTHENRCIGVLGVYYDHTRVPSQYR